MSDFDYGLGSVFSMPDHSAAVMAAYGPVTSDVYFNLHMRVFSIREEGVVTCYAPTVVVDHPRFVVQQSGRRRVLRERQKNIHAFVRSTDHDVYPYPDAPAWRKRVDEIEVTYRPYEAGYFFELETGENLKVVGGREARLVTRDRQPVLWVRDPILEQP